MDLNDRYIMLTFQDVIDSVRMLNREFPRIENKERNIGFYIELKDYAWTIDYAGQDMAAVMYRILKENGLSTLDESA